MGLDLVEHRLIQESYVPPGCRPVGWAALCAAFDVDAPLRHRSSVSNDFVRGSRKEEGDWQVFDKRYWPGGSFADHLSFALRHEPLDLLFLVRLLKKVDAGLIAAYVKSAPTGKQNRRLWFLYEHLTGQTLEIPDAPTTGAVDLLDPEKYITGNPTLSKRHRVRNNLLGVKGFCPIIRRTDRLNELMAGELDVQARQTVGKTSKHLLARAASFMLLADSRASFAIEGERAPRSRLERWGRAVMQTGKAELTFEEFIRLHAILIEDNRFVKTGLRPDGVFLGERDHEGDPLPEFIGAHQEELPELLISLVDANRKMGAEGIDPVLQAAITSFGFVYIHPFQDGNGRLHRCLIHHVLAERGFTPGGMLFPVSTVMLEEIETYRETLQAHTGPLMQFIEWKPMPERNVEVLNDTEDLYRYFDCTRAAEFLYSCVKRTVEKDLPREIDYLKRHDEALSRVMNLVEMPDRSAESLILFIRQNDGKLPARRRKNEFQALTEDEILAIEQIVQEAFDGYGE